MSVSAPQNAAVWFEIPVNDLKAATTFYNTVLQTELVEKDMGPQTVGIFPCEDPMSGVAGHIYEGKPGEAGNGNSRVGTMDCSIAPLTEPDMRTTHPALWIGPSKCQLKLGRYLRGVKFHPSGFQRYQSSCEPGNRIGPRHARTVGLVPNTPAAIRGTGGSPAARPHCQRLSFRSVCMGC